MAFADQLGVVELRGVALRRAAREQNGRERDVARCQRLDRQRGVIERPETRSGDEQHRHAQQGDQMVIAFDPKAKRIANINVNSYMGEKKDQVTLMISYSTLPDGTNFPEKTTLDLPAKQMHITTLNTNYRKLGM